MRRLRKIQAEKEYFMEIVYRPIGTVRTPFKERTGTPIQPAAATGAAGRIEIAPEYVEGLRDLEGFSHLILLYHFHRSVGYELTVVPFLDDEPHGLFATRAPKRPNAIGLSVVRLKSVDGCVLHIENVDLLDGTPLLDIKPYVPQLDLQDVEKIGWFARALGRIDGHTADERFR
jgi:tRNA-Thr(GGU) m(6)t(6)A37 methyltransferase TsaA